jgi:HK97 family phage portal protein
MPWQLKSLNADDEPDNRFITDLFINNNLTQFTIVQNMIKDCLLHGNGFCWIKRDKAGKPVSLKYLPFGSCNIFYNKVTDVLLYQAPMITNKMIEPVDIIHLRMITKDGINGISIIDYANSTIKLAGASEKQAAEYFNSGLTVKGVLSSESPRLTKDQREGIRTAWTESQLGNGVGIPVLEAGLKYQPISSNSKDAELLESRAYSVLEIARFFQISPILLGDLSKSSYNSVEQSELQFVLNTLAPYITMLEQELNAKLIMPSQRYKYYIDIMEEHIIKQDKQSQANYLNTLVNSGIITRNEARKALGYPEIEGADELTVSFTDVNQNKINQDKNTDENNDEEQ